MLAIVAVAVVVVRDRHSDAARQRAHDRLLEQQLDYLDDVRALAGDVRRHVLPVQRVIDALDTPRAGDIYAARDALARPQATADLRRDLHALASLEAPHLWSGHARDLHSGLSQMHDAVVSMRSRGDVVDPDTLNTGLLAQDSPHLLSAEDVWRAGLADLFVERRQQPPKSPHALDDADTPPTLVDWAFAADRVCLSADVAAARYLPRLKSSPLDTGLMRRLAGIIQRFAARLRAIDRPEHGAADLRRDVLTHLGSAAAEAAAIRDEANALDRHDLTGVRLALDRLRTSLAGLPALTRGFRRYHLVACANAVSSGGPDDQNGRPGILT